MSVTERKMYGIGDSGECMVVIRGSLTPGAVTAGNYDDALLDIANVEQIGLSILEGHCFVDTGAFTAGGGLVSTGVVLVPRAQDAAIFNEVSICGVQSAIGAAAEANDHIPDATAPTGFPATVLTGAVAGLPINVGMPCYIPTFRVNIQTGITTAPAVNYLVYLRCAGAKRSH
jgi:hypothetical protein